MSITQMRTLRLRDGEQPVCGLCFCSRHTLHPGLLNRPGTLPLQHMLLEGKATTSPSHMNHGGQRMISAASKNQANFSRALEVGGGQGAGVRRGRAVRFEEEQGSRLEMKRFHWSGGGGALGGSE